jgi:hypothetical protein
VWNEGSHREKQALLPVLFDAPLRQGEHPPRKSTGLSETADPNTFSLSRREPVLGVFLTAIQVFP